MVHLVRLILEEDGHPANAAARLDPGLAGRSTVTLCSSEPTVVFGVRSVLHLALDGGRRRLNRRHGPAWRRGRVLPRSCQVVGRPT